MPDNAFLEKELKDMHQGLSELRATAESKKAEQGEMKTKMEKIEKTLSALDEKNDKIVKEAAEQRKLNEDLKERADELEKKLVRAQAGGTAEKEKATKEVKAFEAWMRKGVKGMADEHKEYMRTDQDTEGGYLAPVEYVNEIIKKITEVSPVRQVARVRKTSRGEIEIPQRTTLLQGGFRGEGGQMVQGQSSYGMVKVPANYLDVIVIATTTMLTDAAFNMESEISADVVESFAQLEGAKFINGVLPIEPEGIASSSLLPVWNSGIANDITADNFMDMQGQLKVGYQPTWLLNRRTLARVRKMKDGMGQYLFTAAQQGLPANIIGDPYLRAIDVPDIGAGNIPVLYGDWMKGYTIVDGITMTTLRDPYTLADTGKVRFIFSKRVGGKITLAEALIGLECSTNSNAFTN